MVAAQPSYALLTDPAELVELAARVAMEGQPVGYDIETGYEGDSREKAAVHPEENFVVGISFTNSLSWARYVPVAHITGPNMDPAIAASVFWLLLTATGPDGQALGVAHNAKFELRSMARWFLKNLAGHPEYGPEVIAARGYTPIRSCTMLESYAEGENRSHGLKEITYVNYGIKMVELLELFPQGLTATQQKSIRFSDLDPSDPKVVAYACDDSHKALLHHLDRYPRVKDSLIYRMEMEDLRSAVCVMEDVGLDYDWNRMREAAISGSEFAEKYLVEVRRDFEAMLGRALPPKFNFGSPPQLQKLLYDPDEGLGLPVTRKTKKGRPSTEAKTALKGLSQQYTAVKKLLNWKGLTKLHRDFLGKFEDKYSFAADGRTHPSLLQHGTVTGRTSAADPNYQQSPKIKYHYELADGSGEFTHNFRDNIRAPLPGMRQWWQVILAELGLWAPDEEQDKLGWYLIGFDYSQIELRVIAGEAGETALLEAFARGDDVHRLTASLMLGMRPEAVTDDDRDVGKTMNFALVYGMSEEGLAERLGITLAEARDLFARYHAAYPRIKQWMEQTIARSKRDGFVMTRFGRKVRIWEYQDADELPSAWAAKMRRANGERTAGNAPIQGAATGDYKKISMARAQRALRDAGLDDRVLLVMDVHDALEWYARKDVPPEDIIAVLQAAVVWEVPGWPPMKAEWHVGERLGSLVKLNVLDDGTIVTESKAEDLPQFSFEDETDEALPEPPPLQPFRFTDPAVAQEYHAPGWAQTPAWKTLPDAPPPDNQARTVVVTLDEMPGEEQVQRFLEYLGSVPGPNTVIVRTSEGDIPVGVTTGAGPQHGAEISMVFGGAITCYDLDSIDMARLASGVDLGP